MWLFVSYFLFLVYAVCISCVFFCSSRRRHTRCALVTGVQTCALPIAAPTIPRFRNFAPVLPQHIRAEFERLSPKPTYRSLPENPASCLNRQNERPILDAGDRATGILFVRRSIRRFATIAAVNRVCPPYTLRTEERRVGTKCLST